MSFPVIPNRYPLGITRILEKRKEGKVFWKKLLLFFFFDKPSICPLWIEIEII
jgi:hypothetical protein